MNLPRRSFNPARCKLSFHDHGGTGTSDQVQEERFASSVLSGRGKGTKPSKDRVNTQDDNRHEPFLHLHRFDRIKCDLRALDFQDDGNHPYKLNCSPSHCIASLNTICDGGAYRFSATEDGA